MSSTLHYGSKGKRVKNLQWRINNNVFYSPRKELVVDGQMGSLTCSAVQQAKHRCGYSKANLLPIAGQLLYDYLSKRVPLPPALRKRRAARLAQLELVKHRQSVQTRLRLRALEIIRHELGTMESPPHSNHIKYNSWWGWGAVAYCVIGISWAWTKAGSTAFKKGARWANTDAMLEDAKAGRNGIHLTSDPDPGCPGVIDFDGHSDPDHAITFIKDNGGGTCTTYEFNTSSGYMEGVLKKDRPLRNCWFFDVER